MLWSFIEMKGGIVKIILLIEAWLNRHLNCSTTLLEEIHTCVWKQFSYSYLIFVNSRLNNLTRPVKMTQDESCYKMNSPAAGVDRIDFAIHCQVPMQVLFRVTPTQWSTSVKWTASNSSCSKILGKKRR